MNNIYTFKPSGNVFRCNEVLGIARNELRQIVNEMNSRGLDSNMRHKVIDNGATHIVVMCLSSGNNRITIDSSYDKEVEQRHHHRERMLHCTVELTLFDNIPNYEKDPEFIILEPLPRTTTKIFLHTLFNIDTHSMVIVKELQDDPDTYTLEQAIPIIEKRTSFKLLEKVDSGIAENALAFDRDYKLAHETPSVDDESECSVAGVPDNIYYQRGRSSFWGLHKQDLESDYQSFNNNLADKIHVKEDWPVVSGTKLVDGVKFDLTVPSDTDIPDNADFITKGCGYGYRAIFDLDYFFESSVLERYLLTVARNEDDIKLIDDFLSETEPANRFKLQEDVEEQTKALKNAICRLDFATWVLFSDIRRLDYLALPISGNLLYANYASRRLFVNAISRFQQSLCINDLSEAKTHLPPIRNDVFSIFPNAIDTDKWRENILRPNHFDAFAGDKIIKKLPEYLTILENAIDLCLLLCDKKDAAIEKYEKNACTDLIEKLQIAFHFAQEKIAFSDSLRYPESQKWPFYNTHPRAYKNNNKLFSRYGMKIRLLTPLKPVLSDFCVRKGDRVDIGDIAMWTNNKGFTPIQDGQRSDDGQLDIKTYNFDERNSCAIFPYSVETLDKKPLQDRFHGIKTGWGVYGRTPVSDFFLPTLEDVICCPQPIESSLDFANIYNSSSTIVYPFRQNADSADLADIEDLGSLVMWKFRSLYTRHYGYSRWAYKYLAQIRYLGSIPNRMILCVRAFFANTPNATSVRSTRRSYDVFWPVHTFWQSGQVYGCHHPIDRYPSKNRTFDNVSIEYSPELTCRYSPNFITKKRDVVQVNLLSTLYAVGDYDTITIDSFNLSRHHASISLVEWVSLKKNVQEVYSKRPWPAFLDGNFEYTNIYGASISVETVGKIMTDQREVDGTGVGVNALAEKHHKWLERAMVGQSIYSDSKEDRSTIQPTRLADGSIYEPPEDDDNEPKWKEEDTPESHMIHCIYRALEKEGYDIHQPICDIKLEANLYDKEVYDDTGEVVQ